MSDDDTGGFDLADAIQNGAERVRETFRFLGVEREKHVCGECQVACEPSYTYDVGRAAFDQGESPSWYCESCGTHYVRETGDEGHALDLYGRDV